MKHRSRVVLVVGAGFTVAAGMPSQRELLPGVGSLDPSQAESAGASAFLRCRDDVARFVNAVFKPHASKALDWTSVDIEDLYSVIDRALIDGDDLVPMRATSGPLRGSGMPPSNVTLGGTYTPQQHLQRVKQSLDYCIMYYLSHSQAQTQRALHERVHEHLVTAYGDSWSTISTNWDSLWDEVLRVNAVDGLLDYGAPLCNILTAEVPQSPPVPRSRIFKLHGSLDWAVCPACHTVFSQCELGSWHSFVAPRSCPRCGLKEERGHYPLLRGLLLTPSMMKSTRSPSLQMIHDEAFLELRQAESVIFIGYSLPPADHDLRYLFRRALTPRTRIAVVLRTRNEAVDRYRRLFGLDETAFHFGGFESYFGLSD